MLLTHQAPEFGDTLCLQCNVFMLASMHSEYASSSPRRAVKATRGKLPDLPSL